MEIDRRRCAHLQPRGRQLIEGWARVRLGPVAEAPGWVRKVVAGRISRGLELARADEEPADAH